MINITLEEIENSTVSKSKTNIIITSCVYIVEPINFIIMNSCIPQRPDIR